MARNPPMFGGISEMEHFREFLAPLLWRAGRDYRPPAPGDGTGTGGTGTGGTGTGTGGTGTGGTGTANFGNLPPWWVQWYNEQGKYGGVPPVQGLL